MAEHRAAQEIAAYIKATQDWYRLFTNDAIREKNSPGFATRIDMAIAECKMTTWGLLATGSQIASVWEIFSPLPPEERDPDSEEPTAGLADRVDNDLFEFLINGTAYIHVINATPSGVYDNLIKEIVESITWMKRARFIDSNLKARCAPREFILEAFQSESWILFVYFLSISSFSVRLGDDDTLSRGEAT